MTRLGLLKKYKQVMKLILCILIFLFVCFHFSNFTAQSSSLTSLASTLSEGLNEATKRSPNHNRSENLKSSGLKTSNHDSSAQIFFNISIRIKILISNYSDHTKFGSGVISVTDLEDNFNNVSARLQSWPAANPKSEWQKNLPVVVFRRAKKSYGSGKKRSIVLDMFNMTIKEGSM